MWFINVMDHIRRQAFICAELGIELGAFSMKLVL